MKHPVESIDTNYQLVILLKIMKYQENLRMARAIKDFAFLLPR